MPGKSEGAKKGNVVLGIDPGTGRLGWAVVSSQSSAASHRIISAGRHGPKTDRSVQLMNCGLIETDKKQLLPKKLSIIFNKVSAVIEEYHPDVMAIEEIFFVKNIKTGISVAHARGVAILAADLNNMEVFEYKPNEIKLSVTGYGHATKDQIQRMLKCHIKNCDIKQDDTADAVAVALTYLQRPKYSIRD